MVHIPSKTLHYELSQILRQMISFSPNTQVMCGNFCNIYAESQSVQQPIVWALNYFLRGKYEDRIFFIIGGDESKIPLILIGVWVPVGEMLPNLTGEEWRWNNLNIPVKQSWRLLFQYITPNIEIFESPDIRVQLISKEKMKGVQDQRPVALVQDHVQTFWGGGSISLAHHISDGEK